MPSADKNVTDVHRCACGTGGLAAADMRTIDEHRWTQILSAAEVLSTDVPAVLDGLLLEALSDHTFVRTCCQSFTCQVMWPVAK